MKMSCPKFCLALFSALILMGASEGFAQSQLVRFDSVFGKFDLELFDNTPLTNANF